MPMPVMQRQRVPDYPRPVPDIDVDEAPICADTVVYERWTDEAEEEAKKRAAKRRRTIQDAAESYLRGEKVVIMSAGLRGPFDKASGWRNPWKRERLVKAREEEIPKTVMRNEAERGRVVVDATVAEKGVGGGEAAGLQKGVIERARLEKDGHKIRSKSDEPVGGRSKPDSTKKVQDWLQRNATVKMNERHIHVQSSPTPATRKGLHEAVEDDGCKQQYVGEDQDAPATVEGPITPDASQSTQVSHESPQRAELAILENMRRSVHKVPPATHLPEFEYRRPRSQGQHQAQVQLKQGEDVCQDGQIAMKTLDKLQHEEATSAVLPEAEPKTSDHTSETRPALSKETSKTSTVQVYVPSAQVVEAPRLMSAPSLAHSTEELLHSVPPVSTNYAMTVSGRGALDEMEQGIGKENAPVPMPANHENTAMEGPPPSSLEKTPERELDTQEIIAGTKQIELSRIKKLLGTAAQRKTPATATKMTKSKSKKQASFAVTSPSSDGSQKSIRGSMKITKAGTGSLLAKGSPKKATFTSLESQVQIICEDEPVSMNDSLPSVSAMFGAKKPEVTKGILKVSPSKSAMPPPTATNDTSASAKQDAQKISEPPVAVKEVDEDENYDLDGAMDELGSYLGTWDADIEASKLVA